MSDRDRPVTINISGIPVAGIGGLGLVAMAVLVSAVMPEVRWMMIAGVAGGVPLAVALVAARRRKGNGPSGDDPKILFRALPADLSAEPRRAKAERGNDCELLTADC